MTGNATLGKVPSLAMAMRLPRRHLGFPLAPVGERGVLPPLCIQMVSPLVTVSLSGSGSGRGQNAERQQSHLLPGAAVATQAGEGILAKPVVVLSVKRSKMTPPSRSVQVCRCTSRCPQPHATQLARCWHLQGVPPLKYQTQRGSPVQTEGWEA